MASVTSLPFVGGELASFDPNDSSVVETTSTTLMNGTSTFNSAYSRCAIAAGIVSGVGCTSPTWSSASTFWVHFVGGFPNGNYYSIGSTAVLYLYSGATVVAQLLFAEAGNFAYSGSFQLQTLQSGVMTNVGSQVNLTFTTLQTVDIQLTAGASGTAALYVAGTLQASGTGLNHSGFSGVTQIALLGYGGSNLAISSVWSQVICDTTSTVGRYLITDNFDTESAVNTGWTGSGGATKLADINDVPSSDITFIYAASSGLTDSFYQSTLSLGTYTVLGRAVSARVRVQGSGPANIKLTLRVGGTNYTASNIALSSGYTATAYTWTTNPATSAAWLPSAAASAEIGVQSAT